MKNQWFDVDPNGLRKNSSLAKAISELAQNGLDTAATEVTINIEPAGHGLGRVVVTDNDPDGYINLSDAWTMFAPSTKAGDDSKRGIFNIGEKEFLSFAREGTITSTSGSVSFTEEGRKLGRKKTERGSVHDFILAMNRDDQDAMIARLREIVLDGTQTVTVNGEVLEARPALKECKVELPLMLASAADPYRFVVRAKKVRVTLHKPGASGSTLHVIGMPVQPISGVWSVNVHGRLRLDQARDQVTAPVLAKVMAAIANMLAEDGELTETDANTWASKTLGKHSTEKAVRAIYTGKFGEDALMAHPTNRGANADAASAGVSVIYGGSLDREAWDAVRRVKAEDPGFAPVTTAKFGDPTQGSLTEPIAESDWTDDARRVVAYAKEAFRVVYGGSLKVTITGGKTSPGTIAAMGAGHMTFNQGSTGWDWFRPDNRQAIQTTIIHELAHHGSIFAEHTSAWGSEACEVGARLALAGLVVHEEVAV